MEAALLWSFAPSRHIPYFHCPVVPNNQWTNINIFVPEYRMNLRKGRPIAAWPTHRPPQIPRQMPARNQPLQIFKLILAMEIKTANVFHVNSSSEKGRFTLTGKYWCIKRYIYLFER